MEETMMMMMMCETTTTFVTFIRNFSSAVTAATARRVWHTRVLVCASATLYLTFQFSALHSQLTARAADNTSNCTSEWRRGATILKTPFAYKHTFMCMCICIIYEYLFHMNFTIWKKNYCHQIEFHCKNFVYFFFSNETCKHSNPYGWWRQMISNSSSMCSRLKNVDRANTDQKKNYSLWLPSSQFLFSLHHHHVV